MELIKSYPSRETIRKYIVYATVRVGESMKQPNIAVRHNAFTDYCLSIIFFATGHRPIQDPIQDQKYFDLELGVMLIADKVSSEDRAWRATALGDVACKQLSYYSEYLPRLYSNLSTLSGSEDLLQKLGGLVNGKNSLPYFFYLNENNPAQSISITPGLMKQRFEEYWDLPLYLFRHIAATELMKESRDARSVKIQLGHTVGPDHQFGVTATESVLMKLSEIALNVDVYMKDLGWEALRSTLRASSVSRYMKIHDKNSISAEFGYEKRAKERYRKSLLIKPLVKVAIYEVLGNEVRLPAVNELSEIIDRVTTLAEKKGISVNRCIALIRRYVRRQKGGKELLGRVNMNYEIKMEASPFHVNSLVEYNAARGIRQDFLDYLDSNYSSACSLDIDMRIAEIIYSSALFSGLADVNKLNSLSKHLLCSTYQFNDEMFVDIPLTDQLEKPIFRWFPDKVSAILISGLFNKVEKEIPVDAKNIINNISALNSKFRLKSSKKESLVTLVDISKSALTFEAPGHVASCLTGKTISVSLPLAQWVRSRTGKALEFETNPKLRAEYDTQNIGLIRIDTLSTRYSGKKSKEFLKRLREVFKEAEYVNLKANSKVSKQRKKELIKLIKLNFSDFDGQQWSPLCLLIMNWAIYLCELGTRSKKDLAFSTIRKYCSMIARVLTSMDLKGNFLNYDDCSFEEIYLKALESISYERQQEFAGRLREFHNFLVDSYAVEEPEWSIIFANLSENISYSDANLVSEAEYLNILNAVVCDPSTSELTKNRYLVLLILGYRFGLRFGEAFRLRYVDFQLSTGNRDPTVILVKNTVYGDTKSEAGVRAVYLLETLTDIENHALAKIHNYARVLFETDSQAALMAESEGSRELINRFTATSAISYYIKRVTGDSTLRYQHLRHSWATRMYSCLVMPCSAELKGPLSNEFVSSFVFNQATKSPLRSISTALGHRSETTTLSHYIHSVDKASQNLISLDDYSFSSKAYAYALGISIGSAKKRSERQTLYSVSNNIRSPNIQLRELGDILLENPIESQDEKKMNLTEIDFLLKRYSQTKQNVDVLAHQLLQDQKLAERVVNVAADVERGSGFEFYQASFFNKDKLLDESTFQLKELKRFKAENVRVTEILEELNLWVVGLNSNEVIQINNGLNVWRKTLRRNLNIITDVQEKAELEFLIEKLDLGMKLSAISENKTATTGSVITPAPFEKNQGRRASGVAVKIDSGNRLRTSQVVSRVLFLLSVYFELNILMEN